MVRIAILYNSFTGYTKHVAQEMGRIFSAMGHSVKEFSLNKALRGPETPLFNSDDFDGFCFGAPVWGFQEPLITQEIMMSPRIPDLGNKPCVFFSTSGGSKKSLFFKHASEILAPKHGYIAHYFVVVAPYIHTKSASKFESGSAHWGPKEYSLIDVNAKIAIDGIIKKTPAPKSPSGGLFMKAVGKICTPGAMRSYSSFPPVIETDICTGCGKCFRECPYNVFDLVDRTEDPTERREKKLSKKLVVVTRPKQCIGCFTCEFGCPVGAVHNGNGWKVQPFEEKCVVKSGKSGFY
ncbi:4Fe-4S binding protein [Aduncisulcus paluster]|uniref:4Fe-4S binding protein n=1 Tax=Aduncisulcus paluster TaxID=2918883 RepID=A0ABQ5K1D4_9EUKA|nr:4Fe-4S binding protein [Aduncisulcus paluster]